MDERLWAEIRGRHERPNSPEKAPTGERLLPRERRRSERGPGRSRGFPDIGALQENLYPTTAQVLDWLVKVMATVPAEDTRLVDLYANLGGADPVVVACALDGQFQDSRYLDSPEWVVVTGDDAVRDKAEEFGLKVLSNAELAAIVDAAEREDAAGA